jgi:hypothetical protein
MLEKTNTPENQSQKSLSIASQNSVTGSFGSVDDIIFS